jgi:15-cis-phytoene synthase
MTPQQYCQEKTASSGSSFYYSFLFLTPEIRRAITALYAFCREVDDIVDECHEIAVAQQKLDWWRNEINKTFTGRPHHPVAIELALLIEPYQLPMEHLLEIIDGMQMDLEKSRYRNMQELEKYCYHAASAVGLVAARLFGYENEATRDYAHDLGMAFQLTNIIRDVREDAARGRVYLPQDLLQQYQVSEYDLTKDKPTNGLRSVLLELATRAENYYESAMKALPESDRWNQRSGLIMSAIYHALLVRIRENDFDVMKSRTSLPKLSKLWIAWKTARRENRRHQYYLKHHAA